MLNMAGKESRPGFLTQWFVAQRGAARGRRKGPEGVAGSGGKADLHTVSGQPEILSLQCTHLRRW